MDFAFSPEQDQLRAAARDYLTDRVPFERVVRVAESADGRDPDVWSALVQLGWLELDDVLDEAVLAEEAGRALLPQPWWSTVALAKPALGATEQPATLAWAEPAAPLLTSGGWTVRADEDGRLTGTKRLVPDLAQAATCVVVADDGLYAVEVTDELVRPQPTLDGTRRLGELHLDATPARRVAGLDVLPQLRRRALALLACEAVGVAQAALDLAASYTKTREQFGRIIGTYQAVSHRVADIYTSVQLARSLAYWAAWAVSADDESAELAVVAAKTAAAEAAVLACESAIQVHGGIGFTYEHPLHRYYKRAQWIDAFEGYGRMHRAAIAAALLDGPQPPQTQLASVS